VSLNPFLAGILIGLGICLGLLVIANVLLSDPDRPELPAPADDSDDLHA